MTNEEAIRLQISLFNDAYRLVLAKRKDYSGDADPFANFRMSEFIGVPPWLGCMVRMMDKLSRIYHIMDHAGEMAFKDEAMYDTFCDILNYTCILAGLCTEELDADNS